jgi:tetratricopeptide (TPR) repeat protein
MSAQPQEFSLSVQERYAEALRHHRAGRAREAERLYREILGIDVRHADSLHLLGVIATGSGRYDEAVDLIGKSLEIEPYSAAAYHSLGIALAGSKRALEAITAYHQALRLSPGLAEAHYNLGNALWDAGRLDEALAAYRRAVDLQPDFARAHYNLANTLRRAGRPDEAITHYNRTLELQPDHARAYVNLGNALLDQGRFDEALARYDSAARLRKPGCEVALENKALVLMQLGRTAQSLRATDEALAINRRSARSWHIRSRLKQFARGDADLGAMEVLLAGAEGAAEATEGAAEATEGAAEATEGATEATEGATEATEGATELSLSGRIQLHFALGTAWLKAGDAERAFAHLDRGNRLKRSTLSYDAEATAGSIAKIIEFFTPELMKRLSRTGHLSDAPVFVIGMPRSGTTLIEQILASHPQVHGAGELSLVHDLLAGVSKPTSGTALDYAERLAQLVPADLARLGADYAQQASARASGRRRMVDKEPLNFLHAGLIHLMLPNARIIHCRRDAVDTCLSCYANLFLSDIEFVYDLRELGLYYRCYEALMAHWRALLPSRRFTEVHYEDVIDNLECEARRLIAFCGLEWNEACLSFHATRRAVQTVSCMQVRQPIYRNSVGRWKSYARYLGPLLAALGVE